MSTVGLRIVSDSRKQGFARDPLKVCLVLKDRGWILDKMATRLTEHLPNWNVEAEIAYSPLPTVDVNHWMLYSDLEGKLYSKNTLAITHVDRPAKLHVLKQRLKKVDMGICMSRMTLEELVLCGIPREKLCFISPAHDGEMTPRRIVIGVTTQIRPDGAKREDVLIKMAHTIRLNAFHFEIVGPRWEKVIPHLEAAGATVGYWPGAYGEDNSEHLRVVHERLLTFDYYLYMGWDEGSMGTLDALAAGIPTIITPQGFHLDINDGITHAFEDSADLCRILQNIVDGRQKRVDSVSELTWDRYAQFHALAWSALRNDPVNKNINVLLHEQDSYRTPLPEFSWRDIAGNDWRVYARSPRKVIWEDFSLLFEWYSGTRLHQTQWYRFAKMVKHRLVGRK